MSKTFKRSLFLIAFLFSLPGISHVYFQSLPEKPKLKKSSKLAVKIMKVPYIYEYPTYPTTLKPGNVHERAWVVYSDRADNSTFSDEMLHLLLNKINFMDSFYVKNETKDALELIKCVPDLISGNSLFINYPDKIIQSGWISKSKLILSQKSFLDIKNRRPLKSITILKGTDILTKTKDNTTNNKLKVFDNPESNTLLNKAVSFNEIIYVYKYFKNFALIGRSPLFKSNTANSTIIGWISKDFVQAFGQRLCIDGSRLLDEKRKVLYPSKDSALKKLSSYTDEPQLKGQGCDNGIFKNKSPVFWSENLVQTNKQIKLFHTGTILNIYDKSNSYIYNLTGSKIENAAFCSIIKDSKSFNVIFVLNNGNDTKDYIYQLNNALQALSAFFPTQKKDLIFKYGATDCYASLNSNSLKSKLTSNYSEILPSMSNFIGKSLEDKSIKSNSSIINGLANASKMLKGKENENNIIVIISSQADNSTFEATDKTLRESTLNDLGKINAKLLLTQPYCGKNPEYANFVQQAKALIKTSSEKAAIFKKGKMVDDFKGNASANNFRSIVNGSNNIYCLDYPENANNQGVLIFPSINNKIEETHFVNAFDTLITQINYDNEALIASLYKVFNSTSSFNTLINPDFQRYYSTLQPLPADFSYYFKNIDYQYFVLGYIAYPQNTTFPPVKQTLLLSSKEYDELYYVFKNLQTDIVNDNYDLNSRKICHQSMLNVLLKYSNERQSKIPESIRFSGYFYEIAGYEPTTSLMKNYKLADLISNNNDLKKDIKSLVAHINKRLALFYSLKEDKQQYFLNNGMKYYWVPEEYLP